MAGRAALPHSGDASVSPPPPSLRMAESVPGTLPRGVADSAGGPGQAGSTVLKLRSGRWRPFAGFRPDARLLIAAALLALVLPAVGTRGARGAEPPSQAGQGDGV